MGKSGSLGQAATLVCATLMACVGPQTAAADSASIATATSGVEAGLRTTYAEIKKFRKENPGKGLNATVTDPIARRNLSQPERDLRGASNRDTADTKKRINTEFNLEMFKKLPKKKEKFKENIKSAERREAMNNRLRKNPIEPKPNQKPEKPRKRPPPPKGVKLPKISRNSGGGSAVEPADPAGNSPITDPSALESEIDFKADDS